MVGALAGVAYSSPGMLRAAFNPVTLNLSVVALAAIGWLSARRPAVGRAVPAERPRR